MHQGGRLIVPNPGSAQGFENRAISFLFSQIFFASRTHTQLTQAISELRRIKFAPTLSTANVSPSFPGNATGKDDSIDLHHVPQTRAVPLGSRKNLCINDDLVASLRRDKKPPRGKEQPLAAGRAQGKDNSARDVGDLDEACRELNNRAFAHHLHVHINVES